jgi:hypothetical protein
MRTRGRMSRPRTEPHSQIWKFFPPGIKCRLGVPVSFPAAEGPGVLGSEIRHFVRGIRRGFGCLCGTPEFGLRHALAESSSGACFECRGGQPPTQRR